MKMFHKTKCKPVKNIRQHFKKQAFDYIFIMAYPEVRRAKLREYINALESYIKAGGTFKTSDVLMDTSSRFYFLKSAPSPALIEEHDDLEHFIISKNMKNSTAYKAPFYREDTCDTSATPPLIPLALPILQKRGVDISPMALCGEDTLSGLCSFLTHTYADFTLWSDQERGTEPYVNFTPRWVNVNHDGVHMNTEYADLIINHMIQNMPREDIRDMSLETMQTTAPFFRRISTNGSTPVRLFKYLRSKVRRKLNEHDTQLKRMKNWTPRGLK